MGCNGDCANCSEKSKSCHADLREKPNKFSSVKKIIGVVSGKGGVGKSMITALLASGLQKRGYKCGILDADITGPSIPKMFGIKTKAAGNEEGLFPGVSEHGMKVMSSHMLLEHDTDPVVWRGPVIAGLVKQFWTDVIWEGIDYLFVDMPPGTGDVPLTVFQSIGVDGIVIVTSPQELVGMIVEKAVKMAEMMSIPVIGLVENMSYIECPDCGKRIEVFGKSNIDAIAKRHKVEVLDKIPINSELSKLSDKGKIEEFDKEYVKTALDKLEQLPVTVLNVACLVNEFNEVSGLKDAHLNIYSTIKRMIVAGKGFDDLSNLVELLVSNKVHILLASDLDVDIEDKIKKAGIVVKNNYNGAVLNAVREYLVGKDVEVEAHDCDGDCEHCKENCDHKDECDGDCEHCDKECNHNHEDCDCEHCKH